MPKRLIQQRREKGVQGSEALDTGSKEPLS